MIIKILRGIIGVIGIFLGYNLVSIVSSLEFFSLNLSGWAGFLAYTGISLLFGFIFLYFSNRIINGLSRVIKFLEGELQKFSIYDILLSSMGLIIGLIIAYLLSMLVYNVEILYINVIVPLVLYIILGYLGMTFPHKKKNDIQKFILNMANFKRMPAEKIDENVIKENTSCPKILDTSVIIDGRILDICRTKFIEGPLVVPEFVLGELQRIADSSDSLKRVRGRRGLDIINEIQRELDLEVIIHEKKFEDIKEVDSKLLKLTKELNGKILTNDYNLNKVAEVQGITVLNINDLANAVKPVVLPGEEMEVQVVKDGKEANQGLAYLDDGTMIVVEKGRPFIGNNIPVIVTSVLQTSAGRMIFARPNK